MVAADDFNTVGTVFQSHGNTMVTSDTSTYPADVVFEDLVSNTSYRYTLRVVSKGNSSIEIGSFSGTFTTSGPGKLPKWYSVLFKHIHTHNIMRMW